MTEKRKQISLAMSVKDVLLLMGEGNPGGLDVLMKLLENEEDVGLFRILALDDMNLRGTQIWVCYKDYCNQDLKKLIASLVDSEERLKMVELVNKVGKEGNHKWKAVESGASYSEDRPVLE